MDSSLAAASRNSFKNECIYNAGAALEEHQLRLPQNQALSCLRFSKGEGMFLSALHIFVKYLHSTVGSAGITSQARAMSEWPSVSGPLES